MPTLTRRKFIGASGLATAGLVTALGTRLAFAAPGTPQTGDTIVGIFLRGGADGLTMAPPYGYDSYRQLRPTIAVPPPGNNGGALALTSADNANVVFPSGLDGVVGLHPAYQPIHETLWAQGNLAVVVATGLPPNESSTRSHFEAETFVERGSASEAVAGGWLGRMINVQNPASALAAVNQSNESNLLAGGRGTVTVSDLGNFGINGFRNQNNAVAAIELLNAGADSVSTEGRNALGTIATIQDLANGGNELGEGFPDSGLGRRLSELSTLLGAGLGIQAAAIDFGGWDHHENLGAAGDTNGRFWERSQELAQALRAFADTTNQLEEITVVVMTEFGRTINENGNRGTDHGRATTYLAMGAGIQGGVFGDDFPDVIADDPDDGDLTVITDYRKALAEILVKRAGVADLATVFPTFTPDGGELGLALA